MDVHGAGGRKFVVIEDSQVFATLTSCAIRTAFPGAHVEEFHSFRDAEMRLRFGDIDVVVCAYGLDEGKTAHDVRALCDAPMVVVTGRPGGIVPPRGSRVVTKMGGPVALRIAIQESLTVRAAEAWCPA